MWKRCKLTRYDNKGHTDFKLGNINVVVSKFKKAFQDTSTYSGKCITIIW